MSHFASSQASEMEEIRTRAELARAQEDCARVESELQDLRSEEERIEKEVCCKLSDNQQ